MITSTNTPSFRMATPMSVSQTLQSSYLSHMTVATKQDDEYWHLICYDFTH